MNVIGFAGFSGSGKTTLIERLIPVLTEQGLRIAVIKHDGEDHLKDCKEKDTTRFQAAGADNVKIASASKTFSVSRGEKSLQEMLKEVRDYDIILVEGYKFEPIPRIGVESVASGHRLPEDISVYKAVVTDKPERYADSPVIVFDRDHIREIAGWIRQRFCVDAKTGEADEKTDRKSELTHIDEEGNARMVNVGEKEITVRTASAMAKVMVNRLTFEMIGAGAVKKGDVLSVAQIAGIMGAKKTPELIPLCHPLLIDGVSVKLRLNEEECCVDIVSEVKCTGRTGVEMEAITAASVAAMTVYDMCKAVQRDMTITGIRLLKKTGGIHGDYQ